MRIRKILLVGVLVVLYAMAMAASSHAEERFGPWVYFAPYYFPPDGCCLGYCFGPADFLPRYESPNPPIPSYDIGACLGSPGPGPKPTKVASRHQISRSAPSMAPVPRLKESSPSPSAARTLQPSSTDRTGVPTSITSTPADVNRVPSAGGGLQQPQAVTHPGPQTSDSTSRTVTRPLQWGQDRR